MKRKNTFFETENHWLYIALATEIVRYAIALATVIVKHANALATVIVEYVIALAAVIVKYAVALATVIMENAIVLAAVIVEYATAIEAAVLYLGKTPAKFLFDKSKMQFWRVLGRMMVVSGLSICYTRRQTSLKATQQVCCPHCISVSWLWLGVASSVNSATVLVKIKNPLEDYTIFLRNLIFFFGTCHNFPPLSSVQIIIIPACCLLCVL